MSELYRHLLIPANVSFLPERTQIAAFYDQLDDLGALPKDRSFVTILKTGRTMLIAEDQITGEPVYGPELKILRFTDFTSAFHSTHNEGWFEFIVEGWGPASIRPFEVYSADDYATRQLGEVSEKPYEYSIYCNLRSEVEQVHWSAFGDHPGEGPSDSGTIEFPWGNSLIQSSGPACARFTIEFGIGDFLVPALKDSIEILDERLVRAANQIFDTRFTQACRVHDD
jgi:hypothetical protein